MIEIEKYYSDVLDGRITACEKMKQASNKILEEYAKPGRYHFDEKIANRHVEFIERFCKIPSGKLGAPFVLEPFQKAMLQTVYGFVDDDNIRKYNEVLMLMGRKNGKTSLCAAIEMDMLINDQEGAPQIYNVATKREQARLGFDACVTMQSMSKDLKEVCKKRATDIFCNFNRGYIKALSKDTTSLDGLNVHCAIIDELSAIKNRDLYDLIKQATSSRKQPLIFCISTNGFLREGIFDAQYEYAKGVLDGSIQDERFLPLIYELDSQEEWIKEDMWIKANPGLGVIKSEKTLGEFVQKAKDDDSFKPTVLVKDFNIKQTAESSWLRYEDIANDKTWDYEGFDYCIGGFDAADTTDLNAAVAICQRPGDENIYVKSMFWIPEEVITKQKATRQERDNAPYELWVQRGLMRTCPGNKCDKRIFLDWYKELRDEHNLYTLYVGYDPWHISDDLIREFKMEFGANSMIPVRQGVFTLSEPMKNLAADFKSHKIIYDNNPILRWNLINTEVKTDVNNNIQPCKSRDKRNRIDGTAALLDGYKVLLDMRDKYVNLNYGE